MTLDRGSREGKELLPIIRQVSVPGIEIVCWRCTHSRNNLQIQLPPNTALLFRRPRHTALQTYLIRRRRLLQTADSSRHGFLKVVHIDAASTTSKKASRERKKFMRTYRLHQSFARMPCLFYLPMQGEGSCHELVGGIFVLAHND